MSSAIECAPFDSNWKKLQGTTTSKIQGVGRDFQGEKGRDRKSATASRKCAAAVASGRRAAAAAATSAARRVDVSKCIALDCEMVGVGPSGKRSALARCCVVDCDGNTLYDKFVRPADRVVDFRTQFSGIRRQHLRKGGASISLKQVQLLLRLPLRLLLLLHVYLI